MFLGGVVRLREEWGIKEKEQIKKQVKLQGKLQRPQPRPAHWQAVWEVQSGNWR